MGAILGWLRRKLLLYLLLVLALLAASLLLPRAKTAWADYATHLQRQQQLQQVEADLQAARADLQARLRAEADAAANRSAAELEQDIAATTAAREAAIGRRRSAGQQRLSILTMDAAALLADRRLELEIQFLGHKLQLQQQARTRLQAAAGKVQAEAALAQQQQAQVDIAVRLRQAEADCARAGADYRAFRQRWPVRITGGLYDRAAGQAKAAARDRACGRRDRLALEQRAAAQVRTLAAAQSRQAQQLYAQATVAAETRLRDVSADIRAAIAREQAAADNSLQARARRLAQRIALPRILRQALWLAVGISLAPFAIRLLCYFGLAPLAERRAAIRLRVPGGAGVQLPSALPSAPSVAVTLAAGEELLVRDDHLQTTSKGSRKRTRWLFDWQYPLTSLLTGLSFLTRIRGNGETTTVSARHDPFSEVTTLVLPAGAACVLQPRALAAVVQEIARPMRISTHWRLGHLNSWLTMQFRYFVFHGPARLVVKGGRGVRIEAAGNGRIFGQDQMVGFSADLAYRVTRNETFWPYFLGRAPLVKDRVEGGAGVLVIEEVPMRNGRPATIRHGIEGMIDAGMKLFGM